jgi:ribosomal-protein-alanine N-acetyltransferase
MEEYAKDNGAERMLLEVREGNAPARTLYKAWGFEEFGVRKNYYEDGENAIVMQKQI